MNSEMKIMEANGEWMKNPKHIQNCRSISTLNSVDLTSEFVKKHNCLLIF